MSTNQYQEMRNRQQAEVNAFPMFFAFNKQQFAEGMRKLGLSPSDTEKSWKMPLPATKPGKVLSVICSSRSWRTMSTVIPAMCRKLLMLWALRPSIWRLFRNCWMAWLWPVKRLCSTIVSTDPERNHAPPGSESTAAAAHMPPAGFSLTGGAIFEFSRNDMRPPLF